MAHGITNSDGVFSVREPMWHGLGTVLENYPTREEVQELVHGWEPATEPLYRKLTRLADVDLDGPVGSTFVDYFEEVSTGVLNVRSDNLKELAVVSPTLVTVTNNEMYEIASVIEGEDPGSVKYETGGTLLGGRKVWLMIRLAEPITISGDPNGAVIPYFAIQNSHDGTGAFRGQCVMDRIVCRNTAQAADYFAQETGTEFTFSHTKNVQARIDEAKKALAGWRTSVIRFQTMGEEMAKERITVHQRETFVEEFIPAPSVHSASDRVMNNVTDARQKIRNILAGPTCEGIDLTTWGLVQASIEYVNHERKANSRESRFKRAYLSRSNVVSDAVDLARDVVLA